MKKKRVILFVAHGSRHNKTQSSFLEFLERLERYFLDYVISYAYLEILEPCLGKRIEGLIKELGEETEFVLVPLLLFHANHAKVDIPKEIQKLKKKYISLEIKMTPVLGPDPILADLIYTRMQEIESSLSNKGEVAILYLGRGMQENARREDFQTQFHYFRDLVSFPYLKPCFSSWQNPSLKEALEEVLLHKEIKKIWVLPHFLFTGLLWEKAKKELEEFQRKNSKIETAIAQTLWKGEGNVAQKEAEIAKFYSLIEKRIHSISSSL